MKKLLPAISMLLSAFLFACGNLNRTSSGINTSPTAAPTVKTETNTTMPPTERSTGDFVASEPGTEKAKPDAGKANVQGKVLYNGQPAENIEVKVCEKFSQYIGGCSGESFTTKTDANGEYLLTKVTPKEYETLMVRVFNTKNYIFAAGDYGISASKYKFEADKTFFAPDTNLFKDDLKVENPKSNAKTDARNLELKWDAYPDAAYYEISLTADDVSIESPYNDEKVEGAAFKVDKPLAAGKYRLRIAAYNTGDVKIADNGDAFEFSVQGGTAGAAPVK